MRSPHDMEAHWWTTSNGSVFLPTSTYSHISNTAVTPYSSKSESSTSKPSSSSIPSNGAGPTGGSLRSSVPISISYTLTSSAPFPITTTLSSSTGSLMTLTTSALSVTTVTMQTISWSLINVGGGPSTSTPTPQNNARSVCAGNGVDTMSIGLFSTLIFGVSVGALIWLLFALLRPRVRQLYGLREWFIRPDLRPPPLGNGFFAFLHPPVPIVPEMPTDVSDFGDSAAGDAHLFPSDDELSQRTIWLAFTLVFAFTCVGLVLALPLYTVSTPCTGNTAPDSTYGGQWSVLQDLSLLRLLQLLKSGNITTHPPASSSLSSSHIELQRRLMVDGTDYAHTARVRLLILTVLLLVVAIFPALIKILREFNKLLAYHNRWTAIRCEGLEMGWLSVSRAPGLKRMGEAQVKALFEKTGMAKRANDSGPSLAPAGRESPRRQRSNTPTNDGEEGSLTGRRRGISEGGRGIDITGIFTIVDTTKLQKLIRARDVVLNSLEKAECLYIDSFRLSTPLPSEAGDSESLAEGIAEKETAAPGGRHISRPRPLRGSKVPRDKSSVSEAPTSYMAPSSYYRLRDVRGVSGGTSRGTGHYAEDQSLSDEFGSRVVGSRFQEVTERKNGDHVGASASGLPSRRPSIAFGHLPAGERSRLDRHTGQPDLGEGPNHGEPDAAEEMSGLDEHDVDHWALVNNHQQVPQILERSSFLSRIGLGFPPLSLRSHQRRQYVAPNISEESFFSPGDAARISASASASGSHEQHGKQSANTHLPRDPGPSSATPGGTSSDGPPPQLRLQLQRPVVRPVSGLHHEQLGTLYSEIRYWRTQLKALNIEVNEEQRSMYEDIANGVNLRGWLLLGRGVRFIPGVRMIEGRSKDDIRWEDLQHESGRIGTVGFWVIVVVVCIVLAGTFVPILGLFMADAPDFAHFVPALNPLLSPRSLGPAIATTLAPSLAAILVTCIALGVVHYFAHLSGAISNSQTRLTAFKATFVVLVVVAGIWMIGLGAVLYSLQSLDTGSQETTSIAEGVIYTSAFVLILGLNMAFIAPGLLMLQPVRLWQMWRSQWKALTPRQHFRAMYPRPYDPSFGLGACIIAIFLTLTLVVLFPLLGLPLVVLVLLTLVAHRYLVGYVYGRTDHGQSGGLLHLWILRRLATMLALQPFLLGLILLPFSEWALAGVLLGSAAFIVFVTETYTAARMRKPGVKSLSEASRESLDEFTLEIQNRNEDADDSERSLPTTPEGDATPPRQTRRTVVSMTSILDMISRTLALPRSAARQRQAIPLPSESINDLVSTARAAATSPEAPPRLEAPDAADDIADLLYPPELLTPDPIVWLINDRAGVGRSEAADLERYHHLQTVLSLAPSSASEPPND